MTPKTKRAGWLYKNHIYWRRPSARFVEMFREAIPITITYALPRRKKV